MGSTRTVSKASLALAAAGALALTACSSSGSKTASDPASGSKTASAQTLVANVSKLATELAQYEKVPAISAAAQLPKASSFDTSVDRGKLVYFIPDSDLAPWYIYQETAVQEAGALTGVNVKVWHNQGQSSQWIAGIRAAINAHASVVILSGQDPASLQTYIQQMHTAGIKVVSSVSYLSTQTLPPNVDAWVDDSWELGEKLVADWTIVKSNGHADTLVITSDDLPASEAMYTIFKSEYKSQCPGCSVTSVNVPIGSWSTQIGPEVQSAIAKDPKLNWVVPILDGASSFVAPAIGAAHATGRIQVASFGGTPAVLQLIKSGGPVSMNAGAPSLIIAWDTFDQALRLMAHQKPYALDETNVPSRIFNASNVSELGSPPQWTDGYGSVDAIKALYAARWQIKS